MPLNLNQQTIVFIIAMCKVKSHHALLDHN